MSLAALTRGGRGRPALALFLLGLALIAVAIGGRMLGQYDLPWHLAFGRQILEDGAIPSVDSFSYARSNIHYLSVVSEILLYGLAAAGGPLALQLFGAALAIALAVILAGRALAHGVAGLAVVALGMFAIHPWLTVRPATLTFVFCAVLLGLIDVHRRSATSRRGRAALIGALVIVPLWANCHGGAVIAVLLLLLHAVHRTLATMFSSRAPRLLPASDRGALRLVWVVALLAPVLVLFNPAGARYFTGVAMVADYAALISEWGATSLDYFVHVAPVAGAFLALAALLFAAGREPSGARVPPLDLLVLFLAAFALVTVKRFVPLAVVILVPLVARRVGHLCRDTARARALLASTLALSGFSILVTDTASRGVGWDPRNFPEAAVRFVEQTGLEGRMWNFWPYGGYLIWRLYPGHQVSLDGRFGLVAYEHDYVMRAIASATEEAPFRAMVAEHDLQWAFCYAGAGGSRSCAPVARDPAWAMVYWDDLAAIYVRREGVNAAQARDGYQVLRHLMPPEVVLDRVLRGLDRDAIARDGALARSQAARSTRAMFFDAVGALAADDGPRFFAALEALGEIAPYHPAIKVLAELVPRLRGVRGSPPSP
jgi:hypothetical protein